METTDPSWLATDARKVGSHAAGEASISVRRDTTVRRVPTRPSINVFVPARNSAAEIGRCLGSLGTQSFLRRGTLRVIVACNACTDGTVDVAEQWLKRLSGMGVEVWCIDIPEGGRANAFNIGEASIGPVPGPRVYLDSNACLSPGALDDLADTLAPGTGAGFAALRVETAGPRSLATRAYARLWPSLPYVRQASSTMGMYAVSEDGRRRWARFPLIHSDDKWVRLHFARSERATVTSSCYSVELPEGVGELYRARVRYEQGNRELRRLFPQLLGDEPRRYEGLSSLVACRPQTLASAACVGMIQGAALIRAVGWRTVPR